MFITVLILSAVVSLIIYHLLRPMLQERVSVLNYRNRPIAGASGLIIIISMMITLAIFALQSTARFGGSVVFSGVADFLILIFGTGLLGLVDDLIGDRKDSGLRGHLKKLKDGKMTTGSLKAIGGISISMYVASFHSDTALLLILNTFLLALSINAFNLLDLRPGRAIKVFLILSLMLFIATFGESVWGIWALMLPPILVLLWSDLNERTMIGDTGSNVLGALFGYTLMVSLNWYVNLAILIVLAAFHYYTERRSLTELILRVRILKRLDELGMRRR